MSATTSESGACAIATAELSRRYGTYVAVDRLNLRIRKGVVFGLLGPNGAGKTTIIKMLTTLLPHSSGSATVAGFDIVARSRAVRSRIDYVPTELLSRAVQPILWWCSLFLQPSLQSCIPAWRSSKAGSTRLQVTGAQRTLRTRISGAQH